MVCPLRSRSSLASFVAALALATSLTAQCGFDWLPGPGANGPRGTAYTILELPNGDLVAGGSFVVADSSIANHIARWNGTTWLPLGAGVDGIVYALARLPNGDLVAGGTFASAGGQPANNIARWNGTSWAPLGPGLDNRVNTLLVLPNGNLVAGGAFRNAGATTTNLVGQWDGVSWSQLGNGLANFEVRSLARMPNGHIIAGGDLFLAGMAHCLQRWDGTSWLRVPGLDPIGSVIDVKVHPSGDLIAAGVMYINGVQTGVVRWNGVAMQSLNLPVAHAEALIARANGDIWVSVRSLSTAPGAYRWNGTSWSLVAGSPPRVWAFAEDSSGRLLVGAEPQGATMERAVTRFDGVNWLAIGAPTWPPLDVRAMVRMPNGDVVLGGSFPSFGGVAANNIARWNGSVWSPLGLGVGGSVSALAAAPNGDLVVSGSFSTAGGAFANRIARWNGQVWSTLGGGLAGEASTLAAGANGEVLAVGGPPSAVQRFNGLTWSTLGIPGTAMVFAMAPLPNGSFALGGLFTGYPGVLLATGGTVTPLPGGPTFVRFLLVDSRGGLVAYGGSSMRRWDGATWTALPSISLASLGELPNGELIGSGPLQTLGSGAASCVYRLRSSGWESFGEIRSSAVSAFPVAASGRGDVFVAGAVQSVANAVSISFAHAVPTCPAATSIVGAGCTGGAGPVTLVANNTPWVGGVFTATASGMVANSLALQVLGSAAPAQPLPGGAPGCGLFVAPIAMDLLVPGGGTATSAWAVPAVPSLAGLQVRLQVVGVELAAAGIVRLTSTNALELTIGAL